MAHIPHNDMRRPHNPATTHSTHPQHPDNIHLNPKHKGLLHKELHVPQGEPIPAAKLEKALHSKNPAERKRANFAKNAKGFSH